jgi:hypothetical protein
MGNTFAASGGMFVKFDQPAYFPGDAVTGRVYMNITKPVSARGVFLKVRGRERIKYHDTRPPPGQAGHIAPGQPGYHPPHHGHAATPGQPGHNPALANHVEFKEFFKVEELLPGLAGHLAAGNYEYPFQFQLPRGLPPSLDTRGTLPNGRAYIAAITYGVTAWCDVAGGSDWKCKSKLNIGNEMPIHRGSGQNHVDAHPKRMGLMSLGTVGVTLAVPKREFVPGEIIEAGCDANNQSSADVQHTKLRLWRTVTMKDFGWGAHKVETKVASVEGPKLPAHQHRNEQLKLQVPYDSYPEIDGQLLQVTYKLVLSLDISMASDPTVEIPVSIFHPRGHQHWPGANAQHQLPPDWTPQVFSPFSYGNISAQNLPPPSTTASPLVIYAGGGAGATGAAPPSSAAPGYGGAPPSSAAPAGYPGGAPGYSAPPGAGAPPSSTAAYPAPPVDHHDHHGHHHH